MDIRLVDSSEFINNPWKKIKNDLKNFPFFKIAIFIFWWIGGYFFASFNLGIIYAVITGLIFIFLNLSN